MLGGLLFSVMDTTIVSTALVSIATDLQDFSNMYWVVLAYILSYIGCAIGFAKLADHFGRLPIFLSSWLLFAAFSLGCGFATTMSQLIVFRALQGIGGSGLYSLSQIALAEIAPHGHNAMIGMVIGMTLAVSFVLGPLLGGAISASNWRWIFYMNIPAGFLCMFGLCVLWPHDFGKPQHPWKEFWRIDFVGNIFILAACALMVYSLQQAGTMIFAWTSVEFLTIFAVSVICWALFWGWQLILRQLPIQIEPVFPMRLVYHRVYMAAVISMFLSGFSYLAIIITLPERFQIVNEDKSLMAGFHLLPMLGATAVGSILGGVFSKKNNNTSRTLVAASCLQIVGLGLLTTFNSPSSPMEPQFGYQIIFGAGVGLTFSSATILTKIQAAGRDHAVAQGVMAQVRVLGGAVGLVVCNAIYNVHIEAVEGGLNSSQLDALHRSPLALMSTGGHTAEDVKSVFASAFQNMVWVMFWVAVAGFVASACTWEVDPTQLVHLDKAVSEGQPAGVCHKQNGSRGGSDTELEDLACSMGANAEAIASSGLSQHAASSPHRAAIAV
ncbi:major facilitator superfamily domain-containing protein [Coniella lustricola]|uniref:Major facilitator superfamily domain-containing protein n=1 Tax=Coniella lustricola TaxID=2025994 RepID=A0A2T3AA77_9PEZI|nr:major facilitator superfamily domain-containing protein [Coniella lustricola]